MLLPTAIALTFVFLVENRDQAAKTEESVVGQFAVPTEAHPLKLIQDDGTAVATTDGRVVILEEKDHRYKVRDFSAPNRTGWVSKREIVASSKAVRFFSDQIESESNNAHAYLRRSMVWLERGDLDIAISDALDAVKHSTEGADVLNWRGSLWIKKGFPLRAIEDFDAAIRIDPLNAKFYCNRACARIPLWQTEKARADFELALKQDPNHVLSYLNRGLLSFRQKDYKSAIKDYSRAIELDPLNSRAWNYRGNAHLLKKEFDQAIADLSKAVELDPNDASAFNNRGIVWKYKRDFSKAARDFRRANELTVSADWIDTRDLQKLTASPLGCAQHQLGWVCGFSVASEIAHYSLREAEARRACDDSDWQDAASLDTLAGVYVRRGEIDKALHWLEKAVQLAPAKDKSTYLKRLVYLTGKHVKE